MPLPRQAEPLLRGGPSESEGPSGILPRLASALLRRGPAPAEPEFVPDPDFMEGMTWRATVEVDLNADGTQTGPRGDRVEMWAVVEGLEDVACRVVQARNPRRRPLNDRDGSTLRCRVLFPAPITLDNRHRLVVVAPVVFTIHHLYCEGVSVDAHLMGHHWYVDTLEYTS